MGAHEKSSGANGEKQKSTPTLPADAPVESIIFGQFFAQLIFAYEICFGQVKLISV